MIGIDTNLLVYAHRPDMPAHEAAAAAIDSALQSSVPVALCWPVVHEFLGVVTRPSFFADPTPTAIALAQVRSWLAAPRVELISETDRHLAVLDDICEQGAVKGAMIHDARVAAIYLENGVSEIWSADRDFSRFPQLRVVNPLAA